MKKSTLKSIIKECVKQIKLHESRGGYGSLSIDTHIDVQSDKIKEKGEDKFFAAFPTLKGKVSVEDVDLTLNAEVFFDASPYVPAKIHPVDSSHDAEGGDFDITKIDVWTLDLFVFDRKNAKTIKQKITVNGEPLEGYVKSLVENLPRDRAFVDKIHSEYSDKNSEYEHADNDADDDYPRN